MYQVLARKWRPKSFSSLKAQEHVTRTLMHAISSQQLHHAYLFTGTRGVGKTSIARILAKSLNCLTGVTAKPCDQCAACIDIDKGCFVDLIEVDAASRTRVEDTRELLENVQYAPTQGRFKIYLIDEVHMLSSHSFNALLKTLEEPPPHVKFILATTDPDRIPMTILSRCLRLNLKPLPTPEIAAQLEHILTEEKIAFEAKALVRIARAAKGSMRDALSLLEQGIAYGHGTVKVQDIEAMLGQSYQQYITALLSALAEIKVQDALQVIGKMAEIGADFEQVLATLLQVFYAIAIAQAVKQENDELSAFVEIESDWLVFKDKFLPEEVQLLYQIGLVGQRDLPFAPSLRAGFEMLLLRMIVFRPVYEASAPQVKKEPPAKVQPTGTIDLDWENLTNQLPLSGLARILVKHCIVGGWDGSTQLNLILDSSQKACLNTQRQVQIQEAISQQLGRSIHLKISLGEVQAESPLTQARIKESERQEQAKQTLLADPIVKDIISTFNAQVEKITVD